MQHHTFGRRDFLTGMGAAALTTALPAAAQTAGEVNVGIILPLSGANAQFGINSRQGIALATDEINAAGGIKALGGARLRLVVADSTSQPTTAATVAQRLITQNRCVAIIGAYASSLTLAVSEVTERRGIPLLTMSFSDMLTERGFKNIFQLVFPISYLNDSLLIIRVMRQQRLTLPVVGGAAGYVIPDFAKALGQYAQAVLSIAPANYDQAPEYTERYRQRFGTFMPHEALEHAVCVGVLAAALEVAKSDKPGAVTTALRAQTYDQGWAGVMSGGGVRFDAAGYNTMAQPVLVQWQQGELVSVYPQHMAKGKVIAATVQ